MAPNPLFFPGRGLPENLELGVAIAPTGHGAHMGVCFRDEADAVWMLHLEFHLRLRREALVEAGRYAVGKVALPAARGTAIALYLQLLWERSNAGRLPYGLKYPGHSFGEDGTLRLPAGAAGFTCATFVAAALAAAKFQFLAEETWPPREDDRAWQEQVVWWLQRAAAPEQHVAAVRAEIGVARLRCEEVTAALLADAQYRPVEFTFIEQPAAFVKALLGANCPRLA